MTNSAVAVPNASGPPQLPDTQGDQRPRICSIPPYASSTGAEAVELVRMAGVTLDPWEEFVLAESLGERKDGKWSAFEVGVNVPRQNGKDAILEAREIAGLFLLSEPLIVHSAHLFDTSLEHFTRLVNLIDGCADLSRRVKRIARSHGEEGITLKSGSRIRFRTRTKGGGRGFTGDCVIFNEAMEIPESSHAAILPTLAARSITGNPQVWYTGSAVDQWIHDNGVVFARIRERGMRGGDPSLAYFEWSADENNPEWVDQESARDPEVWGQANPGLGIRISTEHVAREQASMDSRTFAVERLGVGDWPATSAEEHSVIDQETWESLADENSEPGGGLSFAFDVTPDRSAAAIGVASRREDGKLHIEVVEHGKGTGWVVGRLEELDERHSPGAIVCDASGPAAALLPKLEERGVDIETVTAKEHAQACGYFYDAADQDELRHLDTRELTSAVKGAATRPLGEAWAWSRKSSGVDISPLVACTLALWGTQTERASVYESKDLVTI